MNTGAGFATNSGAGSSGFGNTGGGISGFFNTGLGGAAVHDISGFGNMASGSTSLNGGMSGFGNTNTTINTTGPNFGMSGMFNTSLPSAFSAVVFQVGADSGMFNTGSFLSGLLGIGRL